MKINGCNFKYPKISFGTGKIDLFTDFDKTYCPISHANLKSASPDNNPDFVNYCKNFRHFFDNTHDGLKFHVTTGRTFGEYEAISHLIKDRGFELPLPDTFIAKNGSDEYIKCGTDKDLFEHGVFPFRYDRTNKEKEEAIKKLTNWDGAKLKEKLKEIFKEHDLRIVEGDSENSVLDYGNKSLFSEGKLLDERGRMFHGTDKPDWAVGLRNDGNCKIFITYPQDMNTTPERQEVLKDIRAKINDYFSENKCLSSKYEKQRQDECCGRLYEVIEPLVDKKLANCTDPTVPNKSRLRGLTKLYDTKEAVKRAIENNDLVIVAGDSSNDIPMLNPSLYIDLPEGCKDIADLDPIKHANFIEKYNKMPFIGIIIDRPEKARVMGPIYEKFGYMGDLEDMLKESIEQISKNTPKEEFEDTLAKTFSENISTSNYVSKQLLDFNVQNADLKTILKNSDFENSIDENIIRNALGKAQSNIKERVYGKEIPKKILKATDLEEGYFTKYFTKILKERGANRLHFFFTYSSAAPEDIVTDAIFRYKEMDFASNSVFIEKGHIAKSFKEACEEFTKDDKELAQLVANFDFDECEDKIKELCRHKLTFPNGKMELPKSTILQPKIIAVEEGHLEDGIREAVKLYAKQNPEYAKKLSPDLKKEIFGIIDNPKKSFKTKYIGYAALAVGIITAVYSLVKKFKSKPEEVQKIATNPINTDMIINSKIAKDVLSNNFIKNKY